MSSWYRSLSIHFKCSIQRGLNNISLFRYHKLGKLDYSSLPKTLSNHGTMADEAKSTIFLQPSININGRFKNPWQTWKPPTYGNVFKFLREKSNHKIDSPDVLNSTLPIVKPSWKMANEGFNITWIGHATVVIEFDGITVITDPIFSDRASPISFAGPLRYRPPACTVNDLPPINAVVISHNHYDHLDVASVKSLNQKFGKELYWYVPLGLKSWFQELSCKNVIELNWWESSIHPKKDIKFVLTPSQHWCKRTLNDDNKALWGSWSIIGPKHRFFFAGDTGYCEAFKQIGATYGPFDVAAIPIGAYEPRWFMKYQHVDPEEAVLIHEDIKSKFSVGIHWGTFALANEYYLDPPAKLKEILEKKNIDFGSFITLKHGESKYSEDN